MNSHKLLAQVEEEEKPKFENYTPKMKPGDVEIPNRVFVKGFLKETTEEDLCNHFEQFGKVIDCRIVADKGYGFITFDSQNVAEKVKEMERIKFIDDLELVIGPARIRKKSYQPCYLQDGNLIMPTSIHM